MKKLTAAVVGAVALAGATAVAQQVESLTIVSWGGAYTQSQINAYHEPFTENTGIRILNEDKSAEGLAGIRSQVEAGNVTWNLVDMLQGDAIRACDEGLVVEIPHDEWLAAAPDGSPASEDFIEGTLGDCFIPQILYATMFAYNEEAFPGEKPDSLEDVFNVADFPGTRSLQRIPQKNLEWALIVDGVDPDQVYEVLATEEGQARAFAKLDTIRENVIWWTEGAQPPQMLADQEAVIASAYNGRIFNAQVAEDQPFVIIWDRQMFETDGWVVPVDQSEAQMQAVRQYLHFATDTQRLADQAAYISYAPARQSSVALVGDHAEHGIDMKPHMPTNPENFRTAFRFSPEFWANYGDSLEERFNAWLAN